MVHQINISTRGHKSKVPKSPNKGKPGTPEDETLSLPEFLLPDYVNRDETQSPPKAGNLI